MWALLGKKDWRELNARGAECAERRKKERKERNGKKEQRKSKDTGLRPPLTKNRPLQKAGKARRRGIVVRGGRRWAGTLRRSQTRPHQERL